MSQINRYQIYSYEVDIKPTDYLLGTDSDDDSTKNFKVQGLIDLINSAIENSTEVRIVSEIPSGVLNGSNATFITANFFIPESVEVFLNGIKQSILKDYHITNANTILFNESPNPTETLTTNYIKT